MKSKYVLAGILLLSMVVLAGVSTVLGADLSFNMLTQVKPNVVNWIIEIPWDAAHSGKDAGNLVSTYQLVQGGEWLPAFPKQVHLYTDRIVLTFDLRDFGGTGNVYQAYVTGQFIDGTTFDAYGPGFTYRPH